MSQTTEKYVSKTNLTPILTKIDGKLENRYTKDEVDDLLEYETIPYSTWSTYTPEQQALHPNAIITDAPGGSEGSNGNIEAIVNVYGSKNLNSYPYHETTKTENGITFTVNNDGTITVGGSSAQTASADVYFTIHSRNKSGTYQIIKNGNYIVSGCPNGGNYSSFSLNLNISAKTTGQNQRIGADYGDGCSVILDGDYYSNDEVVLGVFIEIKSGTTIPAGGLVFKPMIRDARISDGTYVPYAMTNKELTDNKANKTDISSISITGSTNNTGSIITSGTWFYLNGELCRAKTDIATSATLTLNTNYEKKTAGEALSELNSNGEFYIKVFAEKLNQASTAGTTIKYDLTTWKQSNNVNYVQYIALGRMSGNQVDDPKPIVSLITDSGHQALAYTPSVANSAYVNFRLLLFCN